MTSRTTGQVQHRGTAIHSRSQAIQVQVMAPAIHTFRTTSSRQAGTCCRLGFNLVRPLVNNMPKLDHTTTGEFQDRFYSFNDGVLRNVEINYAKNGERSVAVLVAIRDANEATNDGWVCVRLIISEVQDFCFADAANTSAAVLSNGIHICWFGAIVGLEFGHFVDSPESPVELKTSTFFVTGSSVEWTVEAY